jgi:hypothetical protein
MLVGTVSGDSVWTVVDTSTAVVVVVVVVVIVVEMLGVVVGTLLWGGATGTELGPAGGAVTTEATALCVAEDRATDDPGPDGVDDATPEGVLGGIVAKTTGTVKVGALMIVVDEAGSVDEFVITAGKSSTDRSGTISSVPVTSLKPTGDTGEILGGKSSAVMAGSGLPTIWAETNTA